MALPDFLFALEGADFERAKEAAQDPNTPIEFLACLAKSKSFAVREATATNPQLPEELQTILADDKSHFVRKALVENPQTKIELLFSLGSEFPKELIQNPIFSLLCLQKPEFLFETKPTQWGFETVIPFRTILALLEEPSLPEYLLRLGAKPDPGSRISYSEALARNPSTPKEILARFLLVAHEPTRASALANPNAPQDLLERIHRVRQEVYVHYTEEELFPLTEGSYGRFLICQLRRPIPPKIFVLVAEGLSIEYQSQGQVMAMELMDRPEIPEEALFYLARNLDKGVHTKALAHLKTPASGLLEALRLHDYDDVKISILHHPNTPIEALQLIAKSNSALLRERAARHPNADAALLLSLSQDKYKKVRQAAAEHQSCPKEALLSLCKDKDVAIRRAVVENPTTPKEALVILAADKVRAIQEDARKHPNAVDLPQATKQLKKNKK